MQTLIRNYTFVVSWLEQLAPVFPLFILRVILAWEFWEAGYAKLAGENWFGDIAFPFPFNLLSPNMSWWLATGLELIGAVALLLGLATRFFAASLMILTVVAMISVHWPEHWSTLGELFRGYRIVDEEGDGFGNYKLPLIYLAMFSPLLFSGAGKSSLDYLISRRLLNWKKN